MSAIDWSAYYADCRKRWDAVGLVAIWDDYAAAVTRADDEEAAGGSRSVAPLLTAGIFRWAEMNRIEMPDCLDYRTVAP